MAARRWDESDLELAAKNFNPATFFGLSTALFDKRGDLRYCNAEPLKLVRGEWEYFTPFRGWIRYGLNVDKFGSSGSSWLSADGISGEWAVGFHGLRRDVLDVVKSIASNGFLVFQGKNSEWGVSSLDVGRNASLFNEKKCGKGVFLTPKLKHLTENIEHCRLMKPIQYNKHFYVEVALQCRIRPKSIRVPECAKNEYYIVNDPTSVRPYGILVRFMTEQQAKDILDDNNFSLAPAIPFVE